MNKHQWLWILSIFLIGLCIAVVVGIPVAAQSANSPNTFFQVCYILFIGLWLLVVFVIGCLVLAVLAIKQRGTFLKRVGRFGLFLGLFLIVASIFNGLWGSLVFGHLYYQDDYIPGDFLPFIPVMQTWMDSFVGFECWHLLGISLFQLQLVWFLFAAGTWGGTILLYRLIRRRLWNEEYKMNTCPHCGCKAVSIFRKLGLTPFRTVACSHCGAPVTVAFSFARYTILILFFVGWMLAPSLLSHRFEHLVFLVALLWLVLAYLYQAIFVPLVNPISQSETKRRVQILQIIALVIIVLASSGTLLWFFLF